MFGQRAWLVIVCEKLPPYTFCTVVANISTRQQTMPLTFKQVSRLTRISYRRQCGEDQSNSFKDHVPLCISKEKMPAQICWARNTAAISIMRCCPKFIHELYNGNLLMPYPAYCTLSRCSASIFLCILLESIVCKAWSC